MVIFFLAWIRHCLQWRTAGIARQLVQLRTWVRSAPRLEIASIGLTLRQDANDRLRATTERPSAPGIHGLARPPVDHRQSPDARVQRGLSGIVRLLARRAAGAVDPADLSIPGGLQDHRQSQPQLVAPQQERLLRRRTFYAAQERRGVLGPVPGLYPDPGRSVQADGLALRAPGPGASIHGGPHATGTGSIDAHRQRPDLQGGGQEAGDFPPDRGSPPRPPDEKAAGQEQRGAGVEDHLCRLSREPSSRRRNELRAISSLKDYDYNH